MYLPSSAEMGLRAFYSSSASISGGAHLVGRSGEMNESSSLSPLGTASFPSPSPHQAGMCLLKQPLAQLSTSQPLPGQVEKQHMKLLLCSSINLCTKLLSLLARTGKHVVK